MIAQLPPSDLGEVTHVISCEISATPSRPNLLADGKIVQPAQLSFYDIMGADGADERLKDHGPQRYYCDGPPLSTSIG